MVADLDGGGFHGDLLSLPAACEVMAGSKWWMSERSRSRSPSLAELLLSSMKSSQLLCVWCV